MRKTKVYMIRIKDWYGERTYRIYDVSKNKAIRQLKNLLANRIHKTFDMQVLEIKEIKDGD